MGTGADTLAALVKLPPSERVLVTRHKVRRGDTLSALARRYGTTVHAIQVTNRMGRRTVLRVGQTLRIPGPGSTRARSAGCSSSPTAPPS